MLESSVVQKLRTETATRCHFAFTGTAAVIMTFSEHGFQRGQSTTGPPCMAAGHGGGRPPAVGQLLRKANTNGPDGPATPLAGIHPGDVKIASTPNLGLWSVWSPCPQMGNNLSVHPSAHGQQNVAVRENGNPETLRDTGGLAITMLGAGSRTPGAAEHGIQKPPERQGTQDRGPARGHARQQALGCFHGGACTTWPISFRFLKSKFTF